MRLDKLVRLVGVILLCFAIAPIIEPARSQDAVGDVEIEELEATEDDIEEVENTEDVEEIENVEDVEDTEDIEEVGAEETENDIEEVGDSEDTEDVEIEETESITEIDCEVEIEGDGDLDAYKQAELYCLFLAELVYGGIELEEEYDLETLKQKMLIALSDSGDLENSEKKDDVLTEEEIAEEFPGNELEMLVEEAVQQAELQASVPASPNLQMSLMKAIADKYQQVPNTPTGQIASGKGRARGEDAAKRFAGSASRRAKQD